MALWLHLLHSLRSTVQLRRRVVRAAAMLASAKFASVMRTVAHALPAGIALVRPPAARLAARSRF